MRTAFLRLCTAITVLSLFFCAIACTDDVESIYAKGLKAFFRLDDLTGTQSLRAALQSPGTFCTVKTEGLRNVITDARGRTEYINRTAAEQKYGKTVCIRGFIVGTPSVPDLSGLQHYNIAFELACPGCYKEYIWEIELAFSTPSAVHCRRCGRTYDLENSGVVTAGPAGRPLFRYHIAYDGLRLVIQN